MNGVYVFLAPVLLLLSIASFFIHFRNERKKTLIERPFRAAKQVEQVNAQNGGQAQAVHQSCCLHKLCHFCPIRR